MSTQGQGDALWGACPDGGDIEFDNGAVVRSGGLYAASYISMFGGNHLDAGDPGSDRKQYWGNHLETDTNRHIRGRTGTLVAGLPLSTGNLLRIEQAALDDHAWMIALGVATSVEVSAAIEAAKWLALTVVVRAINSSETFLFRENWLAGPGEPELSCAQ